MARTHFPEESSGYYPPRARWYSPLLTVGHAMRRRMSLDRLTMPETMRMNELLASVLAPGVAVWLRGPRMWGKSALAGSMGLVLVFLIWMGNPVASYAMGLLISLHSTGVVYYCNPVLEDKPFWWRLAFSVLASAAIAGLIYIPVRTLLQDELLMPVNMYGKAYVVARNVDLKSVHRGDWLAYLLHEAQAGERHEGGAVEAIGGIGLGPVLAVAGDHVAFSKGFYSVNGITYASLAHMPVSGELEVPENDWFLWPNVVISQHGTVGEAMISNTMLQMAVVGRDQLLGEAFHHWFWRRQF